MNEKKLLTVSHSPHLRHEDTAGAFMSDVIIALIPALIWAAYIFSNRVLVITAISVGCCVIFETLFCVIFRRKLPECGLSAVVTGILLAYTLPPAAPLWMPVAGAFIAIVIVKQLFGGIGKNLLNPAVTARVILGFFPQSAHFTAPFEPLPLWESASQVPDMPTVLDSLLTSTVPGIPMFDVFIGNRIGAIGEVSAVLLLAGGLYLLARRVISWHIPVSFMASVLAVAYLFPLNIYREDYMLYHLLSGAVILGAVFLANDTVTTPLTGSGKVIFGIGCGLLTMLARYQGGFDGVYCAILVMNVLVPVIDRLTTPVPFGAKKEKAKKELP